MFLFFSVLILSPNHMAAPWNSLFVIITDSVLFGARSSPWSLIYRWMICSTKLIFCSIKSALGVWPPDILVLNRLSWNRFYKIGPRFDPWNSTGHLPAGLSDSSRPPTNIRLWLKNDLIKSARYFGTYLSLNFAQNVSRGLS